MTDIEMDLDLIHQPSLEVPADDDLINYDSDAADYALNPADDIGFGLPPQPLPEGAQEIYPESTSQHGEFIVQDDAEIASGVGISTAPNEQDPLEQAIDPTDSLGAEPAEPALEALTETLADEIDYGLGEVDYHGEQHGDETHHQAQEETSGQAAENPDFLGAEEQDRVEISWEDNEPLGHETVGREDVPVVQTPTMAAVSFSQMNENVGQENDFENDTNESRDFRQNELQALEDAITEDVITADASMDSTGELLTDNSDSHFPSITVQYQGDEFPFLSPGTEGFFSDAAILGQSMQHVLSGFRSQLGSDIRPEDELVFQVDELGLEFTESNTSLNFTMNQILEVFDLLTKNDNPDCTRTLYTYLSTRINSAKRYEFLVVSAAEGKGLNEVQHIFSQMPPQHDSDVGNGNNSALSGADEEEVVHNFATDRPNEDSEEHEDEVEGDEGEVEGEEEDKVKQEEEKDDEDGEEETENDSRYDVEDVAYDDEDSKEATQSFEETADEQGEQDQGEPVEFHPDADYFDEAGEETGVVPHMADSSVAPASVSEAANGVEMDDSFAHEHSSTTSTLQGDVDGTGLSADADDETAVDVEANDGVYVAEANEDAEIDWRDEDESEVVGDGGSVAGKRSRDDDESNVDDEIDFKRRCP